MVAGHARRSGDRLFVDVALRWLETSPILGRFGRARPRRTCRDQRFARGGTADRDQLRVGVGRRRHRVFRDPQPAEITRGVERDRGGSRRHGGRRLALWTLSGRCRAPADACGIRQKSSRIPRASGDRSERQAGRPRAQAIRRPFARLPRTGCGFRARQHVGWLFGRAVGRRAHTLSESVSAERDEDALASSAFRGSSAAYAFVFS